MAPLYVLYKNAGKGFPEMCLMKMRDIVTLTGSWRKCCRREFNPPLLGFLLVVCKPPQHCCDFLMFLMFWTQFFLKGMLWEQPCALEGEWENFAASNSCLQGQNESTQESTLACVMFFMLLTLFPNSLKKVP